MVGGVPIVRSWTVQQLRRSPQIRTTNSIHERATMIYPSGGIDRYTTKAKELDESFIGPTTARGS